MIIQYVNTMTVIMLLSLCISTFFIQIFASQHTKQNLYNRKLSMDLETPIQHGSTPHEYHQLIEMLETYRRQHNAFILADEPPELFCQRKFALNIQLGVTCGAGIGFGNVVGSFLSNVVLAVALNRTLLVNHQTHTATLVSCHGGFGLQDWLPSMSDFALISKEKGCPFILDNNMTHFSHRYCGLINTDKRFIGCDDQYNRVYSRLSRHHDPSIPDHVMIRINLLSPPNAPYDYGRFVSYGIAQHFVTDFRPSVHTIIHPVLHQTLNVENSVRIGVHVRHNVGGEQIYATDSFVKYETAVMDALQLFRKNITAQSPSTKCFVYIATDRPSTLEILANYSRHIDCTPFHTSKENTKSKYGEHGPWEEGLMPLADNLLLQHSDYLVGSKVSTYSAMIANMVILNAYRHGRLREHLIYWINPDFPQPFDTLVDDDMIPCVPCEKADDPASCQEDIL